MDWVKLYIEYFNFTLKDLISMHLQNGQYFIPEEINYVIWSAIDIHRYFKSTLSLKLEFSTNFLTLHTNTTFLTPEGFLRFSPLRIQDFYQEPGCDCTCPADNYQLHFQKSDKHFLVELRAVVSEMVSLISRNEPGFR